MYKYIGIRGHRGAGKQTIAYLLGVTLNYLYKHKQFCDDFDTIYYTAVNTLCSNPNFIQDANFRNVYFESFADTTKIMLSMLLGISNDDMYDDWCKDSIIINLKDFSKYQCKTIEEIEERKKLCITASQLFSHRYNSIDSEVKPPVFPYDVYITLREIIVYYSKYIMQNFFGANVWIKSLEIDHEQEFFAENTDVFRIFIDVKFSSEISYIKNHGGFILRVINQDNIKEDTEISSELIEDSRYDATLYSTEDLINIKENIKEIAEKIYNEC